MCTNSKLRCAQHIPCQHLCSVLHHSAYSMSASVQCSAPLGMFHVSICAAFCSARLIPCQYLCSVLHHSAYSMSTSVQCSAPLGIFHVSNVCQKGGLSEWLVIRWIKFETVQSDKHTTKPYLSMCKFSYFGVFMSLRSWCEAVSNLETNLNHHL